MAALAPQLDFWLCSCCDQLHDGQREQPAYEFSNGDFQCAFCVELDKLRSEEDSNE